MAQYHGCGKNILHTNSKPLSINPGKQRIQCRISFARKDAVKAFTRNTPAFVCQPVRLFSKRVLEDMSQNIDNNIERNNDLSQLPNQVLQP